MNRRHLPGNFVDNPEALFRKTRAKLKKASSTLKHEASSNQEDRRSFIRNLSSEYEVMANKSIREFSAPTTDNVAPSFDNKTKYSNMCAQDVQTHILSKIVNISK